MITKSPSELWLEGLNGNKAEKLEQACQIGRWLGGHQDQHPDDTSVWPKDFEFMKYAQEYASLKVKKAKVIQLNPEADGPGLSIDANTKILVFKALDLTGGNVREAAKLLGVYHGTVYNWMMRWGYGKPRNLLLMAAG